MFVDSSNAGAGVGDTVPSDPLGFCLCLGPGTWPGPGDRSRKSLVELHFLCSPDTADTGRVDTLQHWNIRTLEHCLP